MSCVALLDEFDEHSWQQQFHPDLSPAGWHIGHMVFIESYWLHEQVLGDNSSTEYEKTLYFPWLSDKTKRGQRLPDKPQHLAECHETHRQNLALYRELAASGCTHELLKDHYLARFLLQHHAQHRETLHYVMQQRQLQQQHRYNVHEPLRPAGITMPALSLADISSSVGHEPGPVPYDNELPAHPIRLAAGSIAARPVSNAEYLSFMNDRGYHRAQHWSAAGWHWQQQQQHEAPEHWRRDDKGNWYGITPRGAAELEPEQAVIGLSQYEAEAFAAWAGVRLPDETEWEVAARYYGELFCHGDAWEWCGNAFYPYPGFRAFPYDGYSLHWFDGEHYTLRGASPWTSDTVRRTSFRNFYTRDKRHIFAGLRLAADDQAQNVLPPAPALL